MSTIVVRASDTALAMDEVVKRLGQDAYILSTKQKNGQVEVRATTEAPKRRKPPRMAPINKTFGEVLAERSAQSVPMGREGRLDAPQQPAFRPDLAKSNGGWPGLAPGFVADLWVELGQAAGSETGFLRQLMDAILDEDHFAGRAPRTVVVGPQGAGKSTLAARLAAQIMTERSGVKPRLIAPRKARLMGEDHLIGQARLLGLAVERPLLNEIRLGPDWGHINPDVPQIFDLGVSVPAIAEQLVVEGQTEVILCLPSGLHPALLARHLSEWAHLNPRICFTRIDEWSPMPEEFCAIAAAGLKLALFGQGSGLVDCLHRPQRSDLRAMANGWLTPAGGGRK